MTKQVYLGNKIRRLRLRAKWTQTHLAEQLDISPSYVNLLEHNKRSLTVPLLFKMAELFGVDLQGFADEDESVLVAELTEVFSDPVFRNQDLSTEELRDLAGHAPAAARAVLSLFRTYRSVRQDAEDMATRLSDHAATSALETRLPPEEVGDMIQERRNHFPELESAAEELWRDADLQPHELRLGLIAHLQREHGVSVEVVPTGRHTGAVRSYDPERKTLGLSEMLPSSSTVFQLAHQIGLLALRPVVDHTLDAASLDNPVSRELGRVALTNYFASAVMMPYDRFLTAARDTRHDVEILQHRFRASFEQVCHRLTTLSRPGQSGVPFHFVRIDIAGNISKRYSGSGIRVARYSGACPRWNVHTAFLTPDQICTQLSEMPDGSTYFCIAKTVRKGGGGYLAPQSHLAVGLGCSIEHAQELVYADGIDLENRGAAVPIGVSCRTCERMDCRQRAFPPLHHQLNVDPNRRGLSFYYAPNT